MSIFWSEILMCHANLISSLMSDLMYSEIVITRNPGTPSQQAHWGVSCSYWFAHKISILFSRGLNESIFEQRKTGINNVIKSENLFPHPWCSNWFFLLIFTIVFCALSAKDNQVSLVLITSHQTYLHLPSSFATHWSPMLD